MCDSLSFRLSLAINLTALVILIGFWVLDYHRERRVHLEEQAGRLTEEAHVLRVALRHLRTTEDFAHYLDAYCQEMDTWVSPGHHIAVANPSGQVVARALARADTELEARMVFTRDGDLNIFPHAGHEYMAVAVSTEQHGRLLVAQSLTPIERIVQRQAVSRALSVTVLLATVLAVTNLLLVRWVRRPIRSLVAGVEAIRAGHYGRRVAELSTTELRFLGDGFNRMSADLDMAQQRRARELAKARRIHFSLLPSSDTSIRRVTWASRYLPADAIGGDFHDFIECPDGRWLWMVADVSGHGIPAALTAAMLKALMRRSVRQGHSLSIAISTLNEELETLVGSEHFVTCLAILYDPAGADLEYINCGHEPGIILNHQGQVQVLMRNTGLPLGVDRQAVCELATCPFRAGESLVLMTDGLPEATNPAGHLLGRGRLQQMIQAGPNTSPAVHVESVMEQVHRFSDSSGFPDDVTLVIVRREP